MYPTHQQFKKDALDTGTQWLAGVLIAFALIVSLWPAIVQGQTLPVGNTSNHAFEVRMQEIVRLNPGVPDFKRMAENTGYNLPNNSTDTLRAGDRLGIWGREFRKWYGYDYPTTISQSPQPLVEPTTSGLTAADLQQALAGIKPDIPWFTLLLTALAIGLLFFALGRANRANENHEDLQAARVRAAEAEARNENRQDLDEARQETMTALRQLADDRAATLANVRTELVRVRDGREEEVEELGRLLRLEALFADPAVSLHVETGDNCIISLGDQQMCSTAPAAELTSSATADEVPPLGDPLTGEPAAPVQA